MASKRKIGRTELNGVMKDLPKPVQEHCKRCKLLATFLLEKIKAEDWFLDLKLNPTYIADAVSYHDVGKSAIPKDAIYFEHCRNAEKKKAYKSHCEIGVMLIEQKFGVSFSNYTAKNFERYLYASIMEHHEAPSGEGFPNALPSDEITTTGKITAIVDIFDNLLFVGKTEEISEADIDSAIAQLRSMAGATLDRVLVDVFLSDKTRLKTYIEFIVSRDKNRRKTDAYGIKLFYYPIFDIRENHLAGYRTEAWINDPYYGMMKPAAFMAVAEQSGQYFRFEKLAFEKLCMEIDKLYDGEHELPRFQFNFSARNFEKKTFLRFLKNVTAKYEIEPKRIVIAVKDADMSMLETDWAEVIQSCRREGFLFMVDEFGDSSTLMAKLADVTIDRMCFKNEYTQRIQENPKTYSVISGLIKIAYSLHIRVMFGNVEKRSDEAELLRIGAKYACGALYGNAVTLRQLKAVGSEAPDDDDGGDDQ